MVKPTLPEKPNWPSRVHHRDGTGAGRLGRFRTFDLAGGLPGVSSVSRFLLALERRPPSGDIAAYLAGPSDYNWKDDV